MPFCYNCGTEYQVGQEVCVNCGSRLHSDQGPSAIDASQTSTAEMQATKTVRILAGAIDIAIVVVLALVLLSPRLRMLRLVGARQIIILAVPSIYLLLKDCLDGKSIGKLFTGISVFNTIERKPAGLADSILRNWFLAIPLLGPTILAAIALFQILSKNKRWGDGLANTIVIQDRKVENS